MILTNRQRSTNLCWHCVCAHVWLDWSLRNREYFIAVNLMWTDLFCQKTAGFRTLGRFSIISVETNKKLNALRFWNSQKKNQAFCLCLFLSNSYITFTGRPSDARNDSPQIKLQWRSSKGIWSTDFRLNIKRHILSFKQRFDYFSIATQRCSLGEVRLNSICSINAKLWPALMMIGHKPHVNMTSPHLKVFPGWYVCMWRNMIGWPDATWTSPPCRWPIGLDLYVHVHYWSFKMTFLTVYII